MLPDDVTTAILRVVVAAALGASIGLERELKGKPAGFRTHMLVSAAAAVFADVSINGFAELSGYDPSRVAADVVSGIGFLGAGAIFAAGGRPRGLTTAAALWGSAAVGLAVGTGRWPVAVTLSALTLATLLLLGLIEQHLLSSRRIHRDLYVVVDSAPHAGAVQAHLRESGVDISRITMHELGAHVGLDLVLVGPQQQLEETLSRLGEVPEVRYASDERDDVDPGE